MENINLTYSEIMYLFADKFISQRAKLANMEKHPTGEKIPVKPLGNLMATVALVFLKEKGYISLSIKDVKNLFIFPGKDVFATKLKEATSDSPDALSGIELKLLNNIGDDYKVRSAVYYLLSNDETLPWGHIIHISKRSLVEKGYLNTTEEKKLLRTVTKYSINSEKAAAAEALIPVVNKALADFSETGEVYKLSLRAIEGGIASRQEHEDSSD